MAAGRRLLVERGYHRLSLEDVAAAAEVTRVTIYRRFGSKLGLLDAIAEDLAQRAQVVTAVGDAAALADPVEAFRAMVREFCRFWGTDPDLLRRLVSLSAVAPEAQRLIDDRERWRYDQIAGFVYRLAVTDRLQPAFDADHAVAAVGAVTGFPACDAMASRLGVGLADLDGALIALLAGVVRLE
ncbi:hypothetical protein GCM10023196_047620 [Actinoallomurus vinaceus]|uniref:HTH tetR-type domain-containing protein n=1 Tax=Actinoallomurus vinaceus TaxID=1080074 RepID=A0ABP8UF16_9ACTN